MTTIESVRRSLSWQYAGHVIEGIVGVLLMAYVVRHVEVQEYGLLLLAMSLSSALMLLDLGLGSILVRVFVKECVEGGARAGRRALATAFVAMTALGVVGFAICALLSLTLPGPFKIPPELLAEGGIIIFLAGIAVQINLPALAIDSMYKAVHQFSALTKIQLLAISCRVFLTVVVIQCGYGILGLMIVSVVTSAIRIVISGVLLVRVSAGIHLSVRECDLKLIRALFGTAGWAALENTGRQLAVPSGAILLGMFASVEAAAIFGVGSRIPMQLWAFINRGTGVALPLVARYDSRGAEGELAELVTRLLRTTVVATVPILIFIAVFSDSIIQVWVGPDYLPAATVMRWLCITSVGVTLSAPAYALLYGTGRVRTAARISLAETLCYLVGGVILIATYGAGGLAAASAVSHVAITIVWYLPRAIEHTHISPFDLGGEIVTRAWRIVLLFCIASGLTLWVTEDIEPALQLLLAALVGAVAYAAVCLPMMRSWLRERRAELEDAV